MDRPMILFCDVHYAYHPQVPVLSGANVTLSAGLTLLLGPNGAGKSTFLKIAAGVERPDRGIVEIEGRNLWREEVAARNSLAFIPEQPDLTPYATIRDVLNLVARLRKAPPGSVEEVLHRIGLAGLENRSIRELSMGQRRRAVLGAAWIGLPRVILLDEPLEAMDRTIREEILAWIGRMLARGSSVIISTHEIEPFMSIAVRALTIRNGTCLLIDPLPNTGTERLSLLESLARPA